MCPTSNLADRLDSYEALAVVGPRSAGKDRQRAWPVYAAAAGSGLALATAAGAGNIVYSGTQNLTVMQAGVGSSTKNIPIGPFGFDMQARRYGSGGLARLAGAGAGHSVLIDGGNNVVKLASGAVISNGAGSFATQGILRINNSFGANGNFLSGQAGFAGVKFLSGGQTHFGWIRMLWTGSTFAGFSGVPKTVTAIDWAYEADPNTPITAGNTGTMVAVPEPSSMAMALLASGSLGVLAWRKRRRELAASAATSAADTGADLN